MYEDNEFSCQMPGKKDYVCISKGVNKQKHLALCNLREMYAGFKEKYPNVKLEFSKFCTFQPKWCILAGSSGTHSVSVWYPSNCNLKIVSDFTKKECMMHRCESCPGRAGLKQVLDEQPSDVDSESAFHYNQWDTTDQEWLTTITTTCEEYKDVLTDAIDKLIKHSYLAKCQAQYLNDKK